MVVEAAEWLEYLIQLILRDADAIIGDVKNQFFIVVADAEVDVSFESNKGIIPVCKDGSGIEFSEEIAKEILLEKEIIINVGLNSGESSSTAWGCDLTYEYVKINGDYRT